jgi:hypothetical protein
LLFPYSILQRAQSKLILPPFQAASINLAGSQHELKGERIIKRGKVKRNPNGANVNDKISVLTAPGSQPLSSRN